MTSIIVDILLSLLFIVVVSGFLFFLLYILYPNLEQRNFSSEDHLIMPWPPGWPDPAKKPLFSFNSPADCHVVRLISSGKGGRQDLCAGFEKCVDVCPRLNFSAPTHTCPFEQEMAVEHALHYRIFMQKLSSFQNKFHTKTREKT